VTCEDNLFISGMFEMFVLEYKYCYPNRTTPDDVVIEKTILGKSKKSSRNRIKGEITTRFDE